MYDPDDIPLPASFNEADLPPIIAMRKAMEEGLDPRNSQNPFCVNEKEARFLTALAYGSISFIDDV